MDTLSFDFAQLMGVLPISTDCNQSWQHLQQYEGFVTDVAGNDVPPRPPPSSK